MHKDAITEDDVVLLHDDLLATGGTMEAACKLVKQTNPKKTYVNFIIELKDLHGREVFGKDVANRLLKPSPISLLPEGGEPKDGIEQSWRTRNQNQVIDTR